MKWEKRKMKKIIQAIKYIFLNNSHRNEQSEKNLRLIYKNSSEYFSANV